MPPTKRTPRPYHIDLETMPPTKLRPAKRFSVSSMFPIRRSSREKRRLSKDSKNPAVVIVRGGDVRDEYIPSPPPPLMSPEELPPPPDDADINADTFSKLPPDALPPQPEELYSSVIPQSSHPTASPAMLRSSIPAAPSPSFPGSSRGGAAVASQRVPHLTPQSGSVLVTRDPLESSPRPLSVGGKMDPMWSVEFEGKMRTLSQNKLAMIEQEKGSKFYGDVAKS